MRIIFIIKELRNKRGLSLKQLSIATGVSTSYLYEIENQYKMPSIIILELIAKGLKVEVKDLYKIEF